MGAIDQMRWYPDDDTPQPDLVWRLRGQWFAWVRRVRRGWDAYKHFDRCE